MYVCMYVMVELYEWFKNVFGVFEIVESVGFIVIEFLICMSGFCFVCNNIICIY